MKEQLDDQKKEFNQGLDEENKITVTAKADVVKQIEGFEPRSEELQNGINTLARAIGDVANKIK